MESVYKKEIFDYLDYREYIKDFYFEKKKNSSFSLNSFAKKVNVTKMAIKFIIDKKRHIGDENIELFTRVLGLEGAQKKYFFILVNFDKAKCEDKKKEYFERLLNFKDSPIREYYLKYSEMGLFKGWYYPVIREMSYMKGFKKEPLSIQKQLVFNVPIEKIREAIKYLEENGFLKGSKPNDFKLKVPNDIRSFVYKKYYTDIIEKARESVMKLGSNERELFNLTISIGASKYQLAKKMISEFRHTLHDTLANADDDCDRVIQVNMQMFTVAKNKENGGCNE